MVSDRKLAANRRNALRSTGPQTPEGKAAVRYNALQHGLLAKGIVIADGPCTEDPGDFQRLHEAFVEDRQPVGITEQLLVERIAHCWWRLGRAARAETAEIRRAHGVPSVEGAPLPASQPRLLAALAGMRHLPGGASAHLQDTSAGIDQLLRVVADARLAVEVNGHLSESQRERLLDAFGKEEGSVGHLCFACSYWITDRETIAQEEPERAANALSPEECRTHLLFTLESERRRLSSLRRKVVQREALERERQARLDELGQACLTIPPEGAADRLLRYETAIERQLYKALAELERLQRRRAGDAVPPPINVEVSNN